MSTTISTATVAPAPERSSPAPVERNIYLDSVEVANPVIVTGRARTFENNVALRLRDARGSLIAETFTTSTGEMGHHNPYRGTLWVTRDPDGEITVEALEYSARDGSEQSLVSATRPFQVERIDATLYFPDSKCTTVHAFQRRIPKSVSHARLLIETLIAGPLPAERGAAAPFPAGSRVESVNLREGVLTVDFNERLQNVGGACQAQMIRASVTRTLQGLPSVKKVVITAGGSEGLALQP
ncbi:MAG TPA: Gmad2 immunoglobulin-like domain-containing protein [Thermoanaerobaculia bacterium]